MADYSTIKGFSVETLASDPYATAAGAGTWASGGNTNLARRSGVGMGTQTAGMIAGGESTPAPSGYAETETYDGTSWTEVNNLNHARKFLSGGAGTSSSGVIAGGSVGPGAGTPMDYGETWDGTSWTEEGTLNTAGRGVTLAGASSTSAMVAGRAPGTANLVEEWNGSTWTEVNDMIGTARYSMGRSGTVTSALFFTGDPLSKESESYDGTSWTTAPTTNYGAYGAGSAGANSSQGVLFGGSMPGSPEGQYANTTETYDGTAWAIQADMALTVADRMGCGTLTSALAIGGYDAGGNTLGSEEWSVPSTVTVAQEGQVWYNSSSEVLKGFGQFISSGAWASGAGMSSYANGIRGFGTQTAAIGVGFYGPSTPLSFTYDGTAWSSINGLVNAPGRYYPGGTGTTTAGICFGGEPGKNNSEEWDGTCWSEENNLLTGRTFITSGGTQTAAFGAGGYAPGFTGKTELWNGTSWSESGDIPVGVQGAGGNGSTTAALAYSGLTANPATKTAITYTFDGTTWSDASADVNTTCSMFGSSGPQTGNTAALKFGGETHPGKTVNTEFYDGSTWTEVANIANARRSVGNAGSTTSALFFGGEPPSGNGLTEEWSVPPAIKTFTAT